MAWLFDVSINIAWCTNDQKTPETEAPLERLSREAAVVLALGNLEVANVLSNALRKKARLTPPQRRQFLSAMRKAQIPVDNLTHTQARSVTLALADKYLLSVYDPAYLELAMSLNVELAPLDKALRQAAKEAGVNVIP